MDEIKKMIDDIMIKERKNYCIVYYSYPMRYPIIREFKNGKEVIKNSSV